MEQALAGPNMTRRSHDQSSDAQPVSRKVLERREAEVSNRDRGAQQRRAWLQLRRTETLVPLQVEAAARRLEGKLYERTAAQIYVITTFFRFP